MQFHIQPLSADEPGKGLHKYSAFTASVCQLRPESRGRLVTMSADPRRAPAIHPNYLATEKDCAVTVAGIRLARRLAETRPLSDFVKVELQPGPDLKSDDELLDFARRHATTIYHPTGTCKMGTDPMAVVDAQLRVLGIDRLRVADASIMPTLVSGNTNAPTIMIGEKVADMILAERVGRRAAVA